MKFEFTPEEEWESLPEPGPGSAPGSDQAGDRNPSPAALIAAAAERLHTRTRADSNRMHTSLNRMLHTVEAARPQPGPSFEGVHPERDVESFRPEAFGPRAPGGARG